MGYTNYYCMDLLRLLLFTASIVISGADESDDDLTMTNDDDYNSQVATVSAYLPKPFACISMVCSFVMVREIIADHRQPNAAAVSNGDPIKRMLLSNAVADLLFSLAYFLTTWPSPHDDVTWGITGNIGNTLTCTIQGFILQLGFVASVIFSAGLSIFYFLTIQFGWKMHHLEKIEKVVQSFIWLTALAAAVYPIPIELYNNNYDVCWLDSYPGDCSGDDCIRGSNPRPHQLAFVILPWSCMALVLAVMMQLFWTVRQIENMSKKYATSTMPTSTTISNGDLGEADNGPRELNYQIYVDRRKSLAGK